MTLARAVDAAKKNDLPATLDALLAAWHTTPALPIADAIGAVGALATPLEPPISGKTAAEREAAWQKRAAEKRPAALSLLLDTLMDTKGSSQTQERLAALSWARDPRLGDVVARILEKPPYNASVSRTNQFWKYLFAVLADLGDPRLLAHAARWPEAWKTKELSDHERETINKRLLKILPSLQAAYGAGLTTLGADDEARCAEVVAALTHAGRGRAAERASSAHTDAELRAAVYAAPDDDGPRLVYADWLDEQGDPRGEFIRLQFRRRDAGRLSAADAKREKDLFAEHGRRWLDSLEPFVLVEGLRFERGFVAVAKAHEFSEDPAWSTVKRLLGGAPADKARLRSVESLVTDAIHNGLSRLPRLAEIEWRGPELRIRWDAPLAELTEYGEQHVAAWRRQKHSVRRAIFGGENGWLFPTTSPSLLAWIFDGLGAKLTDLELPVPISQVAAWVAEGDKRGLERLRLCLDPFRPKSLALEFLRGSDGRLARLTIHGRPERRQLYQSNGHTVVVGDAGDLLAALAPLTLDSVELAMWKPSAADGKALKKLTPK